MDKIVTCNAEKANKKMRGWHGILKWSIMVQCCQLRQHWSAPGGAYSVSALEVQHFAANGDDFTVRIHLHLKLKTWSIESIESMESIQFNLDDVILCHISCHLTVSRRLVESNSGSLCLHKIVILHPCPTDDTPGFSKTILQQPTREFSYHNLHRP